MITRQLTPRHRKGIQLVKDNKIKKIAHRKYLYTVEGSADQTYLVRIVPNDCSCMDFIIRQKNKGRTCKHIIACIVFEFNM